MKRREKKIESGWEVEWCPSVQTYEDGSMNPDSAEYHCRDFATKAEAEAFARTKLDVDVFGSVRITEFRLEALVPEYPWHKTKEYVADEYYIERE